MIEQLEWLPINSLKPHPRNPNKHSPEQITRLAELIKYQGWRHPIIVSKRTGYIVAGHGRLAAAKELCLQSVPVHEQDFTDDDQEYAFLVSDNAIASWAELDLKSINIEVPSLGPDFEIDLLGIKDFVIEPADKQGGEGEDEVPPTPQIAKTKMGDLYFLGEHRLLCGDSTVASEVARLMGDQSADMVFTDPPYGISLNMGWQNSPGSFVHDGRIRRKNSYRAIEGDDKPFDASHILEFFGCEEIFIWGGQHFMPPTHTARYICWDKKMSESGDKSPIGDFELCWSKAQHKNTMIRVMWNGMFGHRKNEDGNARVHPSQKPARLLEEFLLRWGKETKIVWDGYLGSGSTLIACEKTNRRCFGMEIDPLYCDVIISRWEKYTGKKAELIGQI